MNFNRRSDLTPAAQEMLARYDKAVRQIVGPGYPYPIRMREWELWRILTALQDAQPADRILDVGAFNTYLGAYLSQRFPSVTVSDLLMQRCLKSLLRRLHLAPPKPTEASYFRWKKVMRQAGVAVRSLNAANLALPNASFDHVIALSVIEHIPPVEQAVAELFRVLAPGGKLLLTTDCAPEPKPYAKGVRYFSAAELEHLFAPYPVTSLRNQPDFSRENWCYDQGRPVVTVFIEITKPR
jgi:SAM-dependent methyltransferase